MKNDSSNFPQICHVLLGVYLHATEPKQLLWGENEIGGNAGLHVNFTKNNRFEFPIPQLFSLIISPVKLDRDNWCKEKNQLPLASLQKKVKSKLRIRISLSFFWNISQIYYFTKTKSVITPSFFLWISEIVNYMVNWMKIYIERKLCLSQLELSNTWFKNIVNRDLEIQNWSFALIIIKLIHLLLFLCLS